MLTSYQWRQAKEARAGNCGEEISPSGFIYWYLFIIRRYERAEMLHYEMSFWAAKIRPGLILNIPESRQRDRNPTRSTLLNIPSSQVYSHTQWCCLCIDSLSLIISDVNQIATCYWQSSSRGVVQICLLCGPPQVALCVTHRLSVWNASEGRINTMQSVV